MIKLLCWAQTSVNHWTPFRRQKRLKSPSNAFHVTVLRQVWSKFKHVSAAKRPSFLLFSISVTGLHGHVANSELSSFFPFHLLACFSQRTCAVLAEQWPSAKTSRVPTAGVKKFLTGFSFLPLFSISLSLWKLRPWRQLLISCDGAPKLVYYQTSTKTFRLFSQQRKNTTATTCLQSKKKKKKKGCWQFVFVSAPLDCLYWKGATRA